MDRGELDKVIERSVFQRSQRGAQERRPEYREYEDSEPHRERKRRSFLGELSDFE